MTEHLNTLLSEIRSRSLQLATDLKNERAKQHALQQELEQTQALYLAEKAAVSELKVQIESLNISLAEAQNKVVEVPVAAQSRNPQEIDALVKEIEFCIEMLKQA